jgi:hypothetical protein
VSNVDRTKKVGLLLNITYNGLVVAFSGLIVFVGLIVPHLARMAFRSDHRILIPVASIGRAIFLIAADTLARTIISPSELPVGVITAFLGAPFFLILLRKRGSQWRPDPENYNIGFRYDDKQCLMISALMFIRGRSSEYLAPTAQERAHS